MKLRFSELQKSDEKAQKIKTKNMNGYKNINRILHYEEFPFIPKMI